MNFFMEDHARSGFGWYTDKTERWGKHRMQMRFEDTVLPAFTHAHWDVWDDCDQVFSLLDALYATPLTFLQKRLVFEAIVRQEGRVDSIDMWKFLNTGQIRPATAAGFRW